MEYLWIISTVASRVILIHDTSSSYALTIRKIRKSQKYYEPFAMKVNKLNMGIFYNRLLTDLIHVFGFPERTVFKFLNF